MAKRILIAEDDESILASLEFLANNAGMETRCARDGAEAMRAVEEFLPDLVVLDLMLPFKSGLEICHAIRAHPGLKATKVLILTAKGGLAERARGLGAGADDYVVKPFSTRDVSEKLRALLMEPAP
jgi:two-component system alkaline phosphatase synthesis response regulator PhoP